MSMWPTLIQRIKPSYQAKLGRPRPGSVEQATKAQAHSARRLNVSVPSHCELLASQAEILYAEMQKVTINRAKSIYVSANRAWCCTTLKAYVEI
ncbi:hypothetical protein P4S64_02610 [Vibrio sp. M60_M31a]